MALHVGQEEADVLCRHIGQRVRPVFEHALVGALRLREMFAAIGRNPRPEDVVVAAFDDVDRVDLDIAEMSDRGGRRLCTRTEGRRYVEPLRAKPDSPRFRLTQFQDSATSGHGVNIGGAD